MLRPALVVLSCVGVLGSAVMGVNIETVHVGNAGNVADTRYETPGYGSVAYEYNIGTYEVTADQYTEFLNAVADTDVHGLYNTGMGSAASWGCMIERSGSSGSHVYSVASDRADRPVNWTSWGDAARFANWLHNGQPTRGQDLSTTEDGTYLLDGATSREELLAVTRKAGATWAIPTADEWYKAAYHKNDGLTGNYFDYPTSSDNVPSNDLITPDPGNNANFYQNDSTVGSPYWRTEVGEFENSDSPYGTFDQGGNILEWNETVSEPYRGLLGGSCTSHFGNNSGRMHASFGGGWSHPEYQDSLTGFRVAQVPEPATLSLLALGGLALLRRRSLRV